MYWKRRQSICLFCFVSIFNVQLLATNESQISASNQVLNWTQIGVNEDINSIKDNELIDSSNDSIDNKSEEVSIDGQTDPLIQSSNESNLVEVLTQLNTSAESKVNCTPITNRYNHSDDNQSMEMSSELILVNASQLSQYLETKPNISQSVGADCAIVIFYYKWCPFTARTAKHFNALARVYPQFYVLAIDAYGMNSFNMKYGLVGVPTVLFFHNGKVVGKVNDSEATVDGFVSHISHLTGLSPVMSTNITEADLLGPLKSTAEYKFDYLLLFSWIFCFICFSYLFGKSKLFKNTIEAVRNNWREAEAQHEHID